MAASITTRARARTTRGSRTKEKAEKEMREDGPIGQSADVTKHHTTCAPLSLSLSITTHNDLQVASKTCFLDALCGNAQFSRSRRTIGRVQKWRRSVFHWMDELNIQKVYEQEDLITRPAAFHKQPRNSITFSKEILDSLDFSRERGCGGGCGGVLGGG
ncbi:hypothetical protein C8F04DRAFT_1190709 [Mycena alexandri]|uniref:Uncharacterized protein n=1 Tax=Mycena alexandri TaxID=1745969 RepID=A0AAD6SE20_9AGAR|nr:hypothetical protein C8F04DRAFT_1190709 [Mycena alexandri]